MKKTIYTAPEVEQISVRFEENFLQSTKQVGASKLGASSVMGGEIGEDW